MRLWRGRMHVQRYQLKRKENPMHPSKSESLAQDEEYLLPENEAALAATLALMTGFGHGCCDTHRPAMAARVAEQLENLADRKSTRLNSSHTVISYAVFCLKKKKNKKKGHDVEKNNEKEEQDMRSITQ